MTTKEIDANKMLKYLTANNATSKETSTVQTFRMLQERDDDDSQTSSESSPPPYKYFFPSTNLWPKIGYTNITPKTTPESDYFTTEWKDLAEDKPRPVELVFVRTKFYGKYILQNHSEEFPVLGLK